MGFWEWFGQYVVGPAFTALMTWYLTRRIKKNDDKTDKVAEKVDSVAEKVVEVHDLTNSRLSELVTAEKSASYAEGKAEEQTEAAAREQQKIDGE